MELILLLWIGCAVLCWIIANSKGRFAGAWLILGLAFGIFALLAVMALPSVLDDKNAPKPSTHIKCPDCREFILAGARVCRHCGCKLIPQT